MRITFGIDQYDVGIGQEPGYRKHTLSASGQEIPDSEHILRILAILLSVLIGNYGSAIEKRICVLCEVPLFLISVYVGVELLVLDEQTIWMMSGNRPLDPTRTLLEIGILIGEGIVCIVYVPDKHRLVDMRPVDRRAPCGVCSLCLRLTGPQWFVFGVD